MIELWAVVRWALHTLGMAVLQAFGSHFLTALILLPVVAAVVVAFIPRKEEDAQKLVALGSATVVFLLSLAALAGFRVTAPTARARLR